MPDTRSLFFTVNDGTTSRTLASFIPKDWKVEESESSIKVVTPDNGGYLKIIALISPSLSKEDLLREFSAEWEIAFKDKNINLDREKINFVKEKEGEYLFTYKYIVPQEDSFNIFFKGYLENLSITGFFVCPQKDKELYEIQAEEIIHNITIIPGSQT